ncbi:Zeaxanthin glucosyltransferase, partial [Dissostichus eleginoides]
RSSWCAALSSPGERHGGFPLPTIPSAPGEDHRDVNKLLSNLRFCEVLMGLAAR